MITSSGRHSLSHRITRHFEVTRIEDQLLAAAYQALIPIVSRPLKRLRPGCSHDKATAATMHASQSKAGGA
jgi:hypothetical protein